jgi:16S rRNA (guanine527-N7)-methyltransferase
VLKKKLKQVFEQQGFFIDDKQADQFISYYNKLIEVNKVMNLTAITDYDEVLQKHYLDSVMSTKFIDWKEDAKVLDMGTGAGFPGIPLKILYPKLEVVLVDSLNKRVKFLNGVIEELGLTGAKAIHARAEELGRDANYREQFDFCVSRAVATLPVLLEFCIPFLKEGGEFIAYKSLKAQEELESSKRAMKELRCKLESNHSFSLGENERTLLIIKKIEKTPKKYPRKAGTPSKSPL